MRKSQQPNSDYDNGYGLPLAAILDEFLATQRTFVGAWIGQGQNDREEREATFHMSGGHCLRKDVLQKGKAPETPMPGTSARRFCVGGLVEAVMDAALEWKGILIGKQVKVWRDWAFRAGKGHKELWAGRKAEQGPLLDLSECLVVGKLDEVVRWKDRTYLLDVKTVHTKKFDYLDYKLDEGYATQLASYWKTYEDQYGTRIDEGRLVYLDKDTLRLKQVRIDRDIWIPRAVARWKIQRDAWEKRQDTGELPPELAFGKEKPIWACDPRYCSFALAKWPDGKYICPNIAAYWEGEVKVANTKGTYAGFAGELLKLGGNGSGNGKPPKVLVEACK